MTSVVDIGSYAHEMPAGGIEESIPILIERFKPARLYAFDPYPSQPHGMTNRIDNTVVEFFRLAAWTCETTLAYDPRELGSTVMREKNLHGEWRRPDPLRVEGFDFSAWLAATAPDGGEWIVKLDCEGAEFPIIDKMIKDGTDKLVSLLLVEWHDHVMEAQFRDEKTKLLASLSCPVEEW